MKAKHKFSSVKDATIPYVEFAKKHSTEQKGGSRPCCGHAHPRKALFAGDGDDGFPPLAFSCEI